LVSEVSWFSETRVFRISNLIMVDIIPGINEVDFVRIEQKIALVAQLFPCVQIDIADNTMIEHLTNLEFDKFKVLIEKYPKLSFEAHLMVDNPQKYMRALVDAGFKRLIIHVESIDPRLFIDEAHYESVEVGIAIDAPTDFETLEPFLEEVDCVLVMMYDAGPSGQKFQPEQLEKVKTLHTNIPDLPIEVDGGITDSTAKVCVEAGATRLAVTSFFFDQPNVISESLEKLLAATV
jgi:ribulose-phosphate 3-epimerase